MVLLLLLLLLLSSDLERLDEGWPSGSPSEALFDELLEDPERLAAGRGPTRDQDKSGGCNRWYSFNDLSTDELEEVELEDGELMQGTSGSGPLHVSGLSSASIAVSKSCRI